MTDDAPTTAVDMSDGVTPPRPWVAPQVRRLIATSAETGIVAVPDADETLS